MHENPGVTVRPYQDGDIAALHAAALESVAEISPWMSWCHAAYSMEEAETWVRKAQAWHADGSAHEFAIVDADGCYLGGCGVNHIDTIDQFANLGYWVRSSAAGRGVAVAAALQLSAWAFETTALNRLEIVIAVGNTRSRRVAEKVGAIHEATLRKRLIVQGKVSDAWLYCIARPD